MKLESLNDLLVDQVKDLYNAERQIVEALPKMIEQVSSDDLKEALEHHLEETENQVKRLDNVGKIMGIKFSGKKCKGMEGLLHEAEEYFEAKGDESIKDGALIAAAQRVEHYEIAGYGTCVAIAESLGLTEVVDLLEETLSEEKNADSKLTEISESEILTESGEDIEEEQEEEEGFSMGQSGQSMSGNSGRSKSPSRGPGANRS